MAEGGCLSGGAYGYNPIDALRDLALNQCDKGRLIKRSILEGRDEGRNGAVEQGVSHFAQEAVKRCNRGCGKRD
jgi:hypothetical protein